MVDAIVLLCVIPGSEYRIKDELQKVDGVTNSRITFGEYDLFVELTTDNIKDLGRLVSRQIRTITGVTKSITLILTDQIFANEINDTT